MTAKKDALSRDDSPSINDGQNQAAAFSIRKRGVVGLIEREGKLLVIRRASGVAAPGKICFPGGGIEPGETEEAAAIRELQEELGVSIRPIQAIWKSVTPFGLCLSWWQVELPPGQVLQPNPAEVAEVFWLELPAILARDDLLETNRDFLQRLASGEFLGSAPGA